LRAAKFRPLIFPRRKPRDALEANGHVDIVVDDLTGPEIATFLEEHVAEMRAVTPPGSAHAVDLDGLRIPEVTFWTVVDDGAVVGCGAVKRLDDEHGEIKSMRVASTCRRSGVASMLLDYIVAEARRMGLSRLSLETGSFTFFEPTRQLYLKNGFAFQGPFGDYEPDPNSVFMTKTL
jgi:putative acetyltransferase